MCPSCGHKVPHKQGVPCNSIQCPACGNVLRCPHCEIALTHHRTEEIALCHYCDHHVPTPTQCPACQFTGIRYSGLGTQRLEAEVRARLQPLRKRLADLERDLETLTERRDRLEQDLELCVKHEVPMVITSLGANPMVNEAIR